MNLEELASVYDLTGKTIAITGGAGVLGGEMACALVGMGANVVILDRDPALADRLIERLKGSDGRVIVVYCDVLKIDTMQMAQEAIIREFAPVDILINAAGGNRAEATTGTDLSFFDLPEEALRFVFDLNIVGTIMPCQVFGKTMAERGSGVILNISSMCAFTPLTRVPAYSVAKAGVSNFTQWLAVHMAQEYSPNIRVNALAPGFFIGQQNRALLLNDDETLTPRGQQIIDHTPMNRFGDPEDLLGTMLWLVTDASRFVTGIVVPVDGGFSAFSGV